MMCVCFDVETSGLSPKAGGRVIEVGAVMVSQELITAEFSTLIEVDCTIHWAAERVHGIRRAMLRGQPVPADVWPSFLEFVGDAPLVAHNARFDEGFVRFELERVGLSLRNPVRCSLQASRRHFPRLANHRLETVARHVLGEIPADCRLHRALGDARLLARMWGAMGR